MKTISSGKLYDALKPNDAKPIKAIQPPSNRLRRLARSARKPEGKLATPAINVRIDARAPACDRLSPNDAVINGKITLTTALNRCSVICAAQLAASRPQLATGKLTASIFSAFDKPSSSVGFSNFIC